MITPLSEALAERGYDTLTEVQQAVTAPELAGADLLVSAQTGSGKTVGFGLAIAETLLQGEPRLGAPAAPLALIVAPTRELALQVRREIEWLYARTGARVTSCIGGMDAREERRALERGAHIVVGTPGRLRDHIERGALELSDIRAVVLDEADEMLDLGFREDLEFMLGEAPATRRTLLFSATVPPMIAELAKRYQRDAVRVTTLVKGSQHADISYQVVQVSPADVEHAIINLLRFHDAPTAIVFANTRATVARLTARFANRGFAVVSLSGELSQDERSHALQAMRDGRAKVCVATDVAARGIDLPNLELVVHADLPTNTEALLHRSGRTGRAGRKGISALIVPDKITNKAERLLKWAKLTAEWTHAPTPEDIRAKDEARLLADPAWQADLSEDEAAFAAKLVAERTPEELAAACLRLFRANLSAPEELNVKGARAPKQEFGPSIWVALSVGRDKGAEPRWLLPLICRAGNLDKAAIGRIRVRDNDTLVELAEDAGRTMLAGLQANSILENDVAATLVEGTPDLGSAPARGPKPQGRPAPRDGGGDRAAHKPYSADGPRPAAPKKSYGDKPYGDKPRSGKPYGDKPRGDKPYGDKPRGDKPYGDKPRGDKLYGDKRPDRAGPAKDRAPKPYGAKPAFDRTKPSSDAPEGRKPRAAKPGGKPAGKPAGRSFGDKPAGGAKPFGKPGGKPGGKPAPRPGAKPAAGPKRANASDTSKRFVPPKGGSATPRRKP